MRSRETHRGRLGASVLGMAVALAAAALAQEAKPGEAPAAPPEDPALTAALAIWDRKARELRDLAVPFRQEQALRILQGTKETGRGTLKMRRDPATGRRAVRWDYTHPRRRVEVLAGDEVRTYEPDEPQPRVEIRDLAAFGLSGASLDVLGQPIAEVRKAYAIALVPEPPAPTPPPDPPPAPPPIRLRLAPRDAAMARHVAEIEVAMDRDLGLPRTVTMRGPILNPGEPKPRRNVTTFHFDLAAAEVNRDLAADLFVLAPAGVPVVRR